MQCGWLSPAGKGSAAKRVVAQWQLTLLDCPALMLYCSCSRKFCERKSFYKHILLHFSTFLFSCKLSTFLISLWVSLLWIRQDACLKTRQRLRTSPNDPQGYFSNDKRAGPLLAKDITKQFNLLANISFTFWKNIQQAAK